MPIGAIIGGITQMLASEAARKELALQPPPKYSVSPELRTLYSEQLELSETGEGFSAKETSDFKRQQRTLSSQRTQSGRQLAGGGMGSAIRAGAKIGEMESSQEFSAQNEALKRKSREGARAQVRTLAGRIQNVRNLQARADITKRIKTEQAIGAAHAAGLENIIGGIEQFEENIKEVGMTMMGSMGGGGGGGGGGMMSMMG